MVDLKFRPHGDDLDVVPTVVTSGGDGKFKTWTCVDDSDIYSECWIGQISIEELLF